MVEVIPTRELSVELSPEKIQETTQRVNIALEKLGIAERVKGSFYDLLVEDALRSQQPVGAGDDPDDPKYDLHGQQITGFSARFYGEMESRQFPYLHDKLPNKEKLQVVSLDFTPALPSPYEVPFYYGADSRASSFDQKYGVMALGVLGAVHYVTLVEAGFLDKPDIMRGLTSEDFARIAERVGLLRIATWEKLMAEGSVARPEGEGWQYGALSDNPKEEVLNTYEAFRDSAIAFYKQHGDSILNGYLDRTQPYVA